MPSIKKWVPGEKITGENWNNFVDALEKVTTGHNHNGENSKRIPEEVDTLPSPEESYYGRMVRLSTDGRIYLCLPP